MRTRVLFVNEFSCHNSGYAKYGMEVLKRLSARKDIQIAELACYGSEFNANDVARANQLPWDVYFNTPDLNNPEHVRAYNSRKSNQWGEFKFNEVVLNFRPHVVFDVRDEWMMSFEANSPFRDMYNWCIMTTIDAEPQHNQWLYTFSQADGVFTYTDWGKEVLEKQAGNHINLLGPATACASDLYKPVNKNKAKSDFGLRTDIKILGTVMRNQSRKLFPDLMYSFKKYLGKTGRPDVYLYMHTAYPDSAWNIPELLKQYEISNRALFTYKCASCKHVFPNYYQGIAICCPKCNERTATMPKVENGVSEEEIVKIMQCFDLYVQYANSEGQGMCQAEAALCGIPVVGIDYSGMADVIPKVGGVAIKPIHMNTESLTGRMRATPDNDAFVNYLVNFFSDPLPNRSIKGKIARETSEKNYSWDDTANKWYNYFKNVDIAKYNNAWNMPSRIRQPEPYNEHKSMTNGQYVEWLLTKVLCDPTRLHSYMHMRILRDINNQFTLTYGNNSSFFNEDSIADKKPSVKVYTRELAYRECLYLCNEFNKWEKGRLK